MDNYTQSTASHFQLRTLSAFEQASFDLEALFKLDGIHNDDGIIEKRVEDYLKNNQFSLLYNELAQKDQLLDKGLEKIIAESQFTQQQVELIQTVFNEKKDKWMQPLFIVMSEKLSEKQIKEIDTQCDKKGYEGVLVLHLFIHYIAYQSYKDTKQQLKEKDTKENREVMISVLSNWAQLIKNHSCTAPFENKMSTIYKYVLNDASLILHNTGCATEILEELQKEYSTRNTHTFLSSSRAPLRRTASVPPSLESVGEGEEESPNMQRCKTH